MLISLPPPPEMQRALRARDAGYDGVFWFAVKTTGIFCRPSCRSRPARPENLEFFASAGAAAAAGYRPCKRCRPQVAPGAAPAWAAELLATLARDPQVRLREAELRARGIEPARARRWFRQQYGMSFHAYQRARRMSEAFEAIRSGAPAGGYGYESESGFREAFRQLFGEAPARAVQGDCIRVQRLDSPLGPLIAAASDAGILLLEYAEPQRLELQVQALRRLFDQPILPGVHPHLQRLEDELARYFRGELRSFSLPLVSPGSAFQQQVWRALLDIPYGETRSYQQLAIAVGQPAACRAVGTANGRNRLAILIPCHRVVNSGGGLGGYGGGVWRKQRLLELEQGSGFQLR